MAFRGSLQDIRLFVAAYEERSFTAAAAREYSTQSGVSHHVRRLETLLKVRLFNREQSKIEPTPAADLLYAELIEVLRDLDRVDNAVERYAHGFQGRIRFAIMPALAHHIISPVLLKFSVLHPNVKIQVMESYSSSLGSLVASGQVDFAIGASYGGSAGTRTTSILSTRECLIMRSEKRPKTFDLPEIAATGPHDFVFATGLPHRRRAIEACLAANGFAIRSVLEIDSAIATFDLIRSSDWKNVSPAYVMDPIVDSKMFTVIPLTNPALSLDVSLIEPTVASMSPEGSTLVQMIIEEAERNTAAWESEFSGRQRRT